MSVYMGVWCVLQAGGRDRAECRVLGKAGRSDRSALHDHRGAARALRHVREGGLARRRLPRRHLALLLLLCASACLCHYLPATPLYICSLLSPLSLSLSSFLSPLSQSRLLQTSLFAFFHSMPRNVAYMYSHLLLLNVLVEISTFPNLKIRK